MNENVGIIETEDTRFTRERERERTSWESSRKETREKTDIDYNFSTPRVNYALNRVSFFKSSFQNNSGVARVTI